MSNSTIEQAQQGSDLTLEKLAAVHLQLIGSIGEVRAAVKVAEINHDLNRILKSLDTLEKSLIDVLRPLDAIAKYTDVAETVQARGLGLLEAIKAVALDARKTLHKVDEIDDSKYLYEDPNILQALKNLRTASKFKKIVTRVVELLQYIDGGEIPGFVQISGDIYSAKLPEMGILARIDAIKPVEA